MKKTLTYKISKSKTDCVVYIQPGLLEDTDALKTILNKLPRQIVVVTHNSLRSLYGDPLVKILKAAGADVHLLCFPEGEAYKTRQTKEHIEDQMLAQGLGRDTTLIALGGGVVTDLAGFVAATYCRGIPLINVPTSLLGMVDSCIGGKTGVNVPQGKNLIGSIYQPRAVLMDTDVLGSLPTKEIRNGLVEMIKHGMIADAAYFDKLVDAADDLLRLDPDVLPEAILESCRIKTAIVEEDEREEGKRVLLNCGHTVAHAIEKTTSYGIPHGEAVAIGLIVESRMAMEMGILGKVDLERIKGALLKFGLPLKLPKAITAAAVREAMAMDKKAAKGNPRFVILRAIGEPHAELCIHVEEAILKHNIEWMLHDLCSR